MSDEKFMVKAKTLKNRYILICSILILLFTCTGVYWIVWRNQKPLDKGTQVGNFWVPPLFPNWSKKVYRSDIFESVKYSKRINNSSIVITFCHWLPIDGTQMDMDDLKKVIKGRVGKKDV